MIKQLKDWLRPRIREMDPARRKRGPCGIVKIGGQLAFWFKYPCYGYMYEWDDNGWHLRCKRVWLD